MRGTVVLILVLVLSAIWLQGQVGVPGREGLDSAQNYPPVISGCLERSGFYYAVIAKDGTTYNLSGSTNRLVHYVGHQVEVTGNPTVVSLDTTQKDAASSVEEYPVLQVKAVKELAGTCSARTP